MHCFARKFWILCPILPKYAHEETIDIKAVLVQEMSWRKTADKALPGTVRVQCIDANFDTRAWRVKRIAFIGSMRILFRHENKEPFDLCTVPNLAFVRIEYHRAILVSIVFDD